MRTFWHSKYSWCLRCRRVKFPHKAKGMCESCYRNYQKKMAEMSAEEFIKTLPRTACVEIMPGPPSPIRRGVTVRVAKWGIEGRCLTDPYPWPREMPTEMVVDVQGFASVLAEIPVRMVVPV